MIYFYTTDEKFKIMEYEKDALAHKVPIKKGKNEYSILEEVVDEWLPIDIETTVKYPNNFHLYSTASTPHSTKLLAIQFHYNGDTHIFDMRDEENLKRDWSFIDRQKIIGHNLKFDRSFLRYYLNLSTPRFWDTFIVERCLYQGIDSYGYGLDDLVDRYCSIKLSKARRENFMTIKDSPLRFEDVWYCHQDVIHLNKLRMLQEEQVAKFNMRKGVDLEFSFLDVLIDMELKGINIDTEKIKELQEKNIQQLNLLKQELVKYVIEKLPNYEDKQLDMFSSNKVITVDFSSPKQTQSLFKSLGIEMLTKDKGDVQQRETVVAKELRKYKGEHKTFVDKYITYKEKEKEVSTYGTAFLKYLNKSTLKIHSGFNQIIQTGRLSSRDPNMQNVPREGGYRKLFYPDKGNLFIVADYSHKIGAFIQKCINKLWVNSGKAETLILT